jgi:hypothetical protein
MKTQLNRINAEDMPSLSPAYCPYLKESIRNYVPKNSRRPPAKRRARTLLFLGKT